VTRATDQMDLVRPESPKIDWQTATMRTPTASTPGHMTARGPRCDDRHLALNKDKETNRCHRARPCPLTF
jgi:hypothetical protein